MLINAGADVNISSNGSAKRTLLHQAADGNVVEAAEMLILAGANLDAQDMGQTALHLAAERNHIKLEKC
jgi:ankyrin repeat protein